MYLATHPEIRMPLFKEPRFFAEPEPGIPFGGPRVDNRAEYERLFDSPAPLRGESSPSYSQYPRRSGVPERIHALLPEARFVYLVGDPIHRVVSHYMQRVAGEGERRPLSEALGDVADPMNPYLCPSMYAMQVERYLQFFDRDRLLIVDRADLSDDRRTTLREIFRFLGADTDFESPIFAQRANVGYRRLPRSYVAARNSRLGQLAARKVPNFVGRRINQSARSLSSSAERPVVDDLLESRLRGVLGDDVRQLRAITGKAFPSWPL